MHNCPLPSTTQSEKSAYRQMHPISRPRILTLKTVHPLRRENTVRHACMSDAGMCTSPAHTHASMCSDVLYHLLNLSMHEGMRVTHLTHTTSIPGATHWRKITEAQFEPRTPFKEYPVFPSHPNHDRTPATTPAKWTARPPLKPERKPPEALPLANPSATIQI